MTTDTTLTAQHQHTYRCWWNLDQARWVCRDDASAAEVDRPLVDVRDMVVVHTAMLREFRLAPAAVTRTTPGDRKQARAVAAHLRFLCDMLHHHHAAEDELLWPKLRQRTPASALASIEHVEAQHHGIDAALSSVHALRDSWVAAPTIARRQSLVAALEELHTLLSEHLDLEERALLPLAAAVLTEQEWHAIGEAGAAAIPTSALMVAFGMFAYEGDPAVLTDMLSAAPPPVRMLVPRIAPRVYARRARAIHGTVRP